MTSHPTPSAVPSTTSLPRSTPEQQGVDSAKIVDLIDALADAGLELHSLMVLRRGHVIAEGWWAPYEPAGLHLLYSLSKSFTSTAVGLAVNEGLLSVDDLLTSIFSDEVPSEISAYAARLTVRDLLQMATGHREDTVDRLDRTAIVRSFLALPPEEEPGTWFTYNNGATLMLSVIVTKLTGQRVLDYLRPRILEPLGIAEACWKGHLDVDLGFTGLHLATESIAKFGQLYLQQGLWGGRQLIPQSWVAEATRLRVTNPREPEIDWRQGYGYQFWMCQHQAFRGDGAYGQFCVVLPAEEAVVAVTAATENMQGILDCVWSRLLPALQETAIAVNGDGDSAIGSSAGLSARLEGLALPVPVGKRHGAPAELPSAWAVADSTSERDVPVQVRSISEVAGGWRIAIDDGGAEYPVNCGYEAWTLSEPTARPGSRLRLAASAAWTNPSTLTADVIFVETSHRLRISCDASTATTRSVWNTVPLGPRYPCDLALELDRF